MFDSLDERMKQDERAESTSTERVLRYVAIAIASIVLFAGVYFGVRMVE